MKMADIIQTEEDVELAVKMGKWMTEALMAKMTTTLQVRKVPDAWDSCISFTGFSLKNLTLMILYIYGFLFVCKVLTFCQSDYRISHITLSRKLALCSINLQNLLLCFWLKLEYGRVFGTSVSGWD
jgi:hypothetical protein